MCDPSTVLSGDMAKSLFGRMPPKIQSQPWKLAFSTQTDGFSLQNLYRTLEGDVDAPVLVVIADATGDVFGAYLTCVPKATITFDLFSIFYEKSILMILKNGHCIGQSMGMPGAKGSPVTLTL